MPGQEEQVANYVNNGPHRSRTWSDLKNEFVVNQGWSLGSLLKIVGRLITDKPRMLTVSDEHGSENAVYTATNVMAPPHD